MARIPRLIYRFNTIPIKIPATLVAEIDKLILKSIWKFKGPRIAKTILRKNGVGELSLPSFKTYHKAAAIRTVWYWPKERRMGQWNRTGPEINPHIYKKIDFFDRSAKTIQWRKNSLFNKCC